MLMHCPGASHTPIEGTSSASQPAHRSNPMAEGAEGAAGNTEVRHGALLVGPGASFAQGSFLIFGCVVFAGGRNGRWASRQH